jgi:hypothetical protein
MFAGDQPRAEERRLFERFPVEYGMRFKDVKTDISGEGTTRDVCADGLGFISYAQPVPQSKVEMHIDVPDGRKPLQLLGKVVWVKETQPSVYRGGVTFESVDFMDLARIFNRF